MHFQFSETWLHRESAHWINNDDNIFRNRLYPHPAEVKGAFIWTSDSEASYARKLEQPPTTSGVCWSTLAWDVVPLNLFLTFWGWQLFKMSGRGGKKRVKHMSRAARAGVLFPVSRMSRYLRRDTYHLRIGAGAPVYMAAAIEYLTGTRLDPRDA